MRWSVCDIVCAYAAIVSARRACTQALGARSAAATRLCPVCAGQPEMIWCGGMVGEWVRRHGGGMGAAAHGGGIGVMAAPWSRLRDMAGHHDYLRMGAPLQRP